MFPCQSRTQELSRRMRGSISNTPFLVALILLFTGLLFPAAPALAQDATTTPDDTPVRTVAEHFTEFELGGGLLYWLDRCFVIEAVGEVRPAEATANEEQLRRRPATGGTTRTLGTSDFPDCNSFQGLAADGTGIYFWDADAIWTFAPDSAPGAAPTKVIDTGAGMEPQANGLVLTDQYIIWLASVNATTRKLMRTMKDGSGPVETLFSDLAHAEITDAHGVTANNSAIFYIDDGGIWYVANCANAPCPRNKAVSGTQGSHLLFRPSTGLVFNALGTLYWVETFDLNSIEKVRRANCSLQPQVAPNPAIAVCAAPITMHDSGDARWFLGELRLAGNNIYWPEYFFDGGPQDGNIRRIAADGALGSSQIIATGIKQVSQELAVDSQYLYFHLTSDEPGLPQGLYRLALDASAITRDLDADWIEVTQAVQNRAAGVPLIARKATYARGYALQVNGPSALAVTALLYGTRGGSPLTGSPLRPIDGTIRTQAGVGYNRGDPNVSWLFQIPYSWTTGGTVRFRLVVDPGGAYEDSVLANNEVTQDYTFDGKAPICVVFVPVRTHGPYASVDNQNFGSMLDVAKRLWPTRSIWPYYQTEDVAELQTCWKGPIPYPCFGPYELPEDDGAVLTKLQERDFFSDDPDECQDANAKTYYSGMINDSIDAGWAGLGRYNSNVTWFKFPPDIPIDLNRFDRPGAGVTMAHELGHNENRKHVDCGGPDDPDPNYPYPADKLSDGTNDGYMGFDPRTRAVIEAGDAKDYMSYCGPKWTSDYTFKAIFNRIHSADVAGPLAPDAEAAYFSGMITPGVTGALDYGWVYPVSAMSAGMASKWANAVAASAGGDGLSAAHAGEPLAGNVRIRLLDSGGATLAEAPATLFTSSVHGPAEAELGFTAVISNTPASGQVVRVQLLEDANVMDELTPGSAKPVVTILQPAAGETVDAQLVVRWTATDADAGDVLHYTVQYSPDNGGTWLAVAVDITAPPGPDPITLTIDNTTVPGSAPNQARIRVLASDGYHTGFADSPGFTVTNRKPTAVIVEPAPGQSVAAGQTALLRGFGYDAEDGPIEDTSLAWSVGGQPAGTGEEQNVAGLRPGDYPVVLTATDSVSATGTDQATLVVRPLGVPKTNAMPSLDGLCDDAAYAGGVLLPLKPYGEDTQGLVRLLRTPTHLYACFSGMKIGLTDPDPALAALMVDPNFSAETSLQTGDLGFAVGEDGAVYTYVPDAGAWIAGGSGLSGVAAFSSGSWSAEMRIEAGVLGGWERTVGLAAGHVASMASGALQHNWPFASSHTDPATWARTVLGELPVIENLYPTKAIAGGPSFTLIVTGTQMISSTVLWDGEALPTTVISPTQLTAEVSADLIAAPGVVSIVARTPGAELAASAAQLNQDSNALLFATVSPTPTLTSISPVQVDAGSAAFTLNVSGANFLQGSTVLWNGAPMPTTVNNGGQATAQIAAALVAEGQTVSVAITGPGDGAPVSNPQAFEVAPPAPEDMLEIFLPAIQRQ